MMATNQLPFPPVMPPAMALQMLSGLLPPGYPVPFMGPGMVPPAGYDPTQAQAGFPMQFNNTAYGNGIQDLTPRGPRGSRPPNVHSVPPNMASQPQGEDIAMIDSLSSGPGNDTPLGSQVTGHQERQPSRGGRGFGGRGGRGGRSEHNGRNNVVDPNSLTIVVEKLPPEKTNIADLTSWFSKFGTVTNVGVDSRGNRALVSFSTHEEAHKAWKSEEAVFGNRFVVIFWHRPAPGGGAAGQRALEASARTIQKINTNGINEDVDMVDDASKGADLPNGHKPSSDAMDVSMSVTPVKKVEPKTPQEIYEYATRVWLEKMKGIMDVMQSTTASEAEKQEAKAKFKVLKSQKPQPPGSAPVPPGATGPSTEKKANLDLDLDMLASGEGQTLTQEEAQQALARLQELAAERGLDPNGMEDASQSAPYVAGYRGAPTRRGWRGGYRGRGRGRGTAVAMASASLDNRTKKILLTGYDKAGAGDDAALDIIQSFYLVSRDQQFF
jgi:RNA-binding protein 26